MENERKLKELKGILDAVEEDDELLSNDTMEDLADIEYKKQL